MAMDFQPLARCPEQERRFQNSWGEEHMSHRREKRARRVSRAANAALMTAVSLEALCIAAPRIAQAQSAPAATAPQENLEEVIVTGYRASLESALSNKRHSTLPI